MAFDGAFSLLCSSLALSGGGRDEVALCWWLLILVWVLRSGIECPDIMLVDLSFLSVVSIGKEKT